MKRSRSRQRPRGATTPRAGASSQRRQCVDRRAAARVEAGAQRAWSPGCRARRRRLASEHPMLVHAGLVRGRPRDRPGRCLAPASSGSVPLRDVPLADGAHVRDARRAGPGLRGATGLGTLERSVARPRRRRTRLDRDVRPVPRPRSERPVGDGASDRTVRSCRGREQLRCASGSAPRAGRSSSGHVAASWHRDRAWSPSAIARRRYPQARRQHSFSDRSARLQRGSVQTLHESPVSRSTPAGGPAVSGQKMMSPDLRRERSSSRASSRMSAASASERRSFT